MLQSPVLVDRGHDEDDDDDDEDDEETDEDMIEDNEDISNWGFTGGHCSLHSTIASVTCLSGTRWW